MSCISYTVSLKYHETCHSLSVRRIGRTGLCAGVGHAIRHRHGPDIASGWLAGAKPPISDTERLEAVLAQRVRDTEMEKRNPASRDGKGAVV